MTRQTSAQTYAQMEAGGFLSKKRWEVYKTLYNHGPMTQTETCKFCGEMYSDSVKPRFAELKRMGVIIEVGQRICKVSGRNVYLWDVTEKLPKIEVKSKRDRLLEQISKLKNRMDKLVSKLEELDE